jgi:hypothetical protein
MRHNISIYKDKAQFLKMQPKNRASGAKGAFSLQ